MTDCLAHLGIETGTLSFPDMKVEFWCACGDTLHREIVEVPGDISFEALDDQLKKFVAGRFGEKPKERVYMGWEEVEE